MPRIFSSPLPPLLAHLLAVCAALPAHAQDAPPVAEAVLVTREACGSAPNPLCLSELNKVCHAHPTFRCYYSRKAHVDTVRHVGFPETHGLDLDE